jgi:hypothetical protein
MKSFKVIPKKLNNLKKKNSSFIEIKLILKIKII